MKIIKLFVLCFFTFNCSAMDSFEQIKIDFDAGKISTAKKNMREHLVGCRIALGREWNKDWFLNQGLPYPKVMHQSVSFLELPFLITTKSSKSSLNEEKSSKILEDLKHQQIVQKLIEKVD